jgi:uncharacterized protein (DUF433 family)
MADATGDWIAHGTNRDLVKCHRNTGDNTPGPDAVAGKPYIGARSPSQPSVSCLRGVMLDWSECPAVERVPGKASGEWLFKGTRVPVRALFENLENGARVDDFLTWFPGVTREHVEQVLRHTKRSLAPA